MIEHSHPIKVYYRDVDKMGIVYYSRYFEYFEEGRTEMLKSIGLSINSIEIALNSKELIKIKFRDFKDQKKNLSEDIERLTNSNIVGIIGNILILFRESHDPDNIKILI